jgi:hypothetical protein
MRILQFALLNTVSVYKNVALCLPLPLGKSTCYTVTLQPELVDAPNTVKLKYI